MIRKTALPKGVLILVLCCLSSLSLFAQNFKVDGRVTDEANKPIEGVTVQVKGSKTSTSTKADGSFSIMAPSGTSTLVFSSVGFAATEVAINNRNQITFALSATATSMQDVVVVGYGTRRRSDVTGSISSVTSEEIRSVPVTNISQALQGRVPGLVATQSSFRPGSGSSIRIRGSRSLTANNDPLYVVDGIPMASENALDDLNPLDIESVDVLKDASATAIYGSRGANGVIQITTKKGKSGRVSIEYSGSVSFEKMLVPLRVFNGQEWADEKRQGYFASKSYTPTLLATNTTKYYFPDPVADYALFFTKGDIYTWRSVAQGYTWINQGALIAAKRVTTAEERALMQNLGIAQLDSVAIYDPNKVGNFDWQSQTLRTGITQNHNISLTAGSDKFRTAFSGGYFKQKGIELGQDYTRYTFSLSNEIKPATWIGIGSNINYSNAIQNLGPSEYGGASGQIPLAQPYDSTGKIILNPGNDPNIFNPLNDVNTVFNENKINRLLANLYADVQLYKGLKFRSAFGIDYRNERQGTFNGSISSVRAGTPANGSYTTRDRFNWTLQNMLTYETRFGQHHSFSVLAAQEMVKNTYETNSLSAENLSYESQKWYSLHNNNLGTTTGSGRLRQIPAALLPRSRELWL
jgi:TonB-linked SusC/RagA family outer membrane protein